MFIPDPDLCPSRIPNIILLLKCWRKKIWPNFQRIIEVYTQKILIKLSKIWVWDPRSGIRKKFIPGPGVKKAPDPGSRIQISNTGCTGVPDRPHTLDFLLSATVPIVPGVIQNIKNNVRAISQRYGTDPPILIRTNWIGFATLLATSSSSFYTFIQSAVQCLKTFQRENVHSIIIYRDWVTRQISKIIWQK